MKVALLRLGLLAALLAVWELAGRAANPLLAVPPSSVVSKKFVEGGANLTGRGRTPRGVPFGQVFDESHVIYDVPPRQAPTAPR